MDPEASVSALVFITRIARTSRWVISKHRRRSWLKEKRAAVEQETEAWIMQLFVLRK